MGSFNTINIGSVGQRALNLLAIKVVGFKKMSAASAFTAELCASAIRLGSIPRGFQSFSKFDRQKLCNIFVDSISVQESSSTFNLFYLNSK